MSISMKEVDAKVCFHVLVLVEKENSYFSSISLSAKFFGEKLSSSLPKEDGPTAQLAVTEKQSD